MHCTATCRLQARTPSPAVSAPRDTLLLQACVPAPSSIDACRQPAHLGIRIESIDADVQVVRMEAAMHKDGVSDLQDSGVICKEASRELASWLQSRPAA